MTQDSKPSSTLAPQPTEPDDQTPAAKPDKSKGFWSDLMAEAKRLFSEWGEKAKAAREKMAQEDLENRKRAKAAEQAFKSPMRATSIKNGQGIPLPYGAYLEPVRKIPKGIRILKANDDMIKLRFFSMRGSIFVPLICGFMIWVLLAAYAAQVTFDDGQASEWSALITLLMIGGLIWFTFPRVVVVITKDWLKFGGRYFLMRNVGGVITGAEVHIQFKNSVNVIPLTYLYVSYGPWGERTDYVNSPDTAINFAVYISDLIEEMRSDKAAHETEQGEREQIF